MATRNEARRDSNLLFPAGLALGVIGAAGVLYAGVSVSSDKPPATETCFVPAASTLTLNQLQERRLIDGHPDPATVTFIGKVIRDKGSLDLTYGAVTGDREVLRYAQLETTLEDRTNTTLSPAAIHLDTTITDDTVRIQYSHAIDCSPASSQLVGNAVGGAPQPN